MTWKPLHSDDKETVEPITSSLARLAARLKIPQTDVLTQVFANWEDVVGPEIAKHVKPQSIVDGVLTVVTDDAAWATQLKWLGASIIGRLNDATTSQVVDRIEVRIQPLRSTE